jgi:hypothetical protein
VVAVQISYDAGFASFATRFCDSWIIRFKRPPVEPPTNFNAPP